MGQPFREKSENHSVLSQAKSTTTASFTIANGETVKYGYNYLRRLCRERGLLFEDPDFPPTPRMLFGKNKKSYTYISWLRPFEICGHPKFVSDGASRFEIEQGDLGDCWLVAAISCLTLTPRFLERVAPSDQNFGSGYCGIFRFRFWRFGEWVEVIIDDRLPTFRGRLLYLHSSDPTEFWAALLEKAYAKFYGGYDNLHSSHTGQVLQDLTGGIAQSFHLSEHDPHVVFQMINSAVTKSTILAASILLTHSTPIRLRNGLVTQQAYNITGMAKVRTDLDDIILVRMRNPRSKSKWNGPWSDRSWEWDRISERDQELLALQLQNEEEFWMCFEDFIQNYTHLDLLHIGPDDWMQEGTLHNRKPWRAVLARRRWRNGYNAGGSPEFKDTTATNPQFRVHIPDNGIKKCHMVVSVIQNYHPSYSNENKKKNFVPIGFAIYEVPTNMSRLTTQFVYSHHPLDITIHSPARETVTFFTLPPGNFIIMPCTNSPNCEAKFLLRILMDEHCTIWEVNDDNIIYRDLSFFRADDFQLNQKRRTIILKLIEKFPDDIDSILLLKILRTYWKSLHLLTERPGLELCRNLIMLKDPLITGKIYKTDIICLLSALQFWRTIFLKFDSNHKERINSFYLRLLLMETGITVSNKVLECLIVRFAKNNYFLFETFILALVKLYLAHERYHAIEYKAGESTIISLEEMILMTIYS